MMKIVEFMLEDGTSILVEVDEAEAPGGITPAARPGETAVTKARQTLEAALDDVRPFANTIITKLHDLVDQPDKVEVEFGVKLSTATNAIIAAASAEANITITLTWKKPTK